MNNSVNKIESFVLFGALGDLSVRKLIPAWYYLERDNVLNDNLKILGVGRKDITKSQFLIKIQNALKNNVSKEYLDDDTIFSFPDFSEDIHKNINLICMKAFNSIGCSNWGRVDFFMDNKSLINLIEINSIPGMTDHSLVPKSAKKNGFSYHQLLLLLLQN